MEIYLVKRKLFGLLKFFPRRKALESGLLGDRASTTLQSALFVLLQASFLLLVLDGAASGQSSHFAFDVSEIHALQ